MVQTCQNLSESFQKDSTLSIGSSLSKIFQIHLCIYTLFNWIFFRIRVGRSIQGFGLSPGITKQQRVDVEALMKNAFAKLEGDLAGNYYPLTGMDEAVRQQLVDDHFLFMSGDPNLKVAGTYKKYIFCNAIILV